MTVYDYDTWFVYELIDPRTKAVFYIGKTATPKARLAAHKRSPESAAFVRIGEIRSAGYEVEMYLIGRFNTEPEALDYEAYLIDKTPGLVNRLGNGYAAEEFTRPVLAVADLDYTTAENQPIPDIDTMAEALAVLLPNIRLGDIIDVLKAKAVLFDVDYEYAGVTDE